MSALCKLIIVIVMQCATILMVATHVIVTRDMKEME